MLHTSSNFRAIVIALVVVIAGCVTPEPDVGPRFDPANPRNAPTADDYPPASRKLGEEGYVILALLIMADGSIGDIRVEKSSGFRRLDDAAIAFYRDNGKFLPSVKAGKKVAAWKTLKVVWSLIQPSYDSEGRRIN